MVWGLQKLRGFVMRRLPGGPATELLGSWLAGRTVGPRAGGAQRSRQEASGGITRRPQPRFAGSSCERRSGGETRFSTPALGTDKI